MDETSYDHIHNSYFNYQILSLCHLRKKRLTDFKKHKIVNQSYNYIIEPFSIQSYCFQTKLKLGYCRGIH